MKTLLLTALLVTQAFANPPVKETYRHEPPHYRENRPYRHYSDDEFDDFNDRLPQQEITEIDIANPPARLRDSELFRFFRERKMTTFPRTYSSLVQQLKYFDYAPHGSFIPRGRSAQAAATDERNPRYVFASVAANKLPNRYPLGFEDYSAFPGPDSEGRLFFGFATRTGRGEVISENPGTRKADYFVVEGMGTQRVKIYEVRDRNTCNKCHPNQAATWSVPPWSEIMNHDPFAPEQVAPKVAFASDPTVFSRDGVLFTRETTPIQNNGALAIDSSSSVSNRIRQALTILTKSCGDNLHCRRYVVMAAMANPVQSTYLRKVVTQKSTTGNDLNDLDFIVGPLNPLRNLLQPGPNNIPQIPTYFEGFAEYVKPSWARDGYAFPAHILPDPSTVQSGTTTQRQADPLTPRFGLGPIPQELAVPYIWDVAFDALGFSFQESLALQKMTLAERMAPFRTYRGVIEEGSDLDYVLSSWPPKREDILNLYGFEVQQLLEHERYYQQGRPVRQAQAVVVANATANAPAFGTRCAGCHADKESKNAPYIPFADLAELKKYNAENNQNVEARLGQRSMPPESVTDRPTEAEYQQMLQFFVAEQPVAEAKNRGKITTNYLGIRYQNVDGLRNSYIALPGVEMVKEGYTDDCGTTLIENRTGIRSMKAAQGSDGAIYLALENFPHYFLGNIVQVVATKVEEGGCRIFAVSRNGKLVNLGYSRHLGKYGSITLQEVVDTGASVKPIAHLSALKNRLIAVGKDGNLYRVAYPVTQPASYKLLPLNVTGISQGRWFKTAFKQRDGKWEILGETVRGQRSGIRLPDLDSEFFRMTPLDVSIANSDFAPNLLDRLSIVLNPGQYLDDEE